MLALKTTKQVAPLNNKEDVMEVINRACDGSRSLEEVADRIEAELKRVTVGSRVTVTTVE